MYAILPKGHPFRKKERVTMADLVKLEMILLDEGDVYVPLALFHKLHLTPHMTYKVYDDYTIMEMVRHGIGISMLFHDVIQDNEQGFIVKPIKEHPSHHVARAWKNNQTLSYASKELAKSIIAYEKP
jgi:DNA-binding transcriptional LysR family regulator